MPRQFAVITQADVAQLIRAVKQARAHGGKIRSDGKLLVHFRELPIRGEVEAEEDVPVWPLNCVTK